MSNRTNFLDKIRKQLDVTRQELVSERERILAERLEIEAELSAIESQLAVLETLADTPAAASRDVVKIDQPLSHRVLVALKRSGHGLTSREIRNALELDHRNSRNLGPVLNQLAKSGKVENNGRGSRWHISGGS